MRHPSLSEDRLLALEVETALKALRIASGGDERRDVDLRTAMDDLRGALPGCRIQRFSGVAPSLLAEDEIFGLSSAGSR